MFRHNCPATSFESLNLEALITAFHVNLFSSMKKLEECNFTLVKYIIEKLQIFSIFVANKPDEEHYIFEPKTAPSVPYTLETSESWHLASNWEFYPIKIVFKSSII